MKAMKEMKIGCADFRYCVIGILFFEYKNVLCFVLEITQISRDATHTPRNFAPCFRFWFLDTKADKQITLQRIKHSKQKMPATIDQRINRIARANGKEVVDITSTVPDLNSFMETLTSDCSKIYVWRPATPNRLEMLYSGGLYIVKARDDLILTDSRGITDKEIKAFICS